MLFSFPQISFIGFDTDVVSTSGNGGIVLPDDEW